MCAAERGRESWGGLLEGHLGVWCRPLRDEAHWERKVEYDLEVTGESGRKRDVGSNVILVYEGNERSTS